MISTEPVSQSAEIPVTVHASRTTQGARVHEETRTVAALPDGAVVRLKARLPPGELVVLTNGQNGSRVVCRVKYAKRPPGSADCVELEFIKPAPEFWSEAAPAAQPQPRDDVGSEAVGDGATAVAGTPPVQPQNIDAAGVPGPELGARSGGARMPVWRQGREVQEIKPPLTESGASLSGTLFPSLTNGFRPAALASGAADEEDDEAGDGSLASNIARHAGTKIGVLVIVAAISIANGAVIGAWFQRLWTRADASSQVVPQQAVSSSMGAQLGNAGPPAGALSVAASVPDVRGSVPARVAAAAVAPAVATRRDLAPAADVERSSPTDDEASLPTPRSNLVIGEMQAPVRKKAPVAVLAGDAPLIADEGRNLSQIGTAVVLLTGVGAKLAPPTPPMGGQLVPLQLVASPAAVYPVAARSQGIEGVVTLDVLVDATGKVTETTVILGHPLLQSAARAAVSGWKYQPARLNGAAIPMRTKVTVRFSLH